MADYNSAYTGAQIDEGIGLALTAMPYDATSTNLLINGGFDFWQRGTSQTSSGYGSDDRWQNVNVTSSKTHSRQAFAVGQTDVPNNPKYYSRTAVTTGGTAGSSVSKQQYIEDVTRLSRKVVTLSFYAKADASKNLSIDIWQNFGTGGSANVVGVGVNKFALTTVWQLFTATITLPSVSGKTIGANSHTAIRFLFDAGSDYNSMSASLGNQSGTFDIANVQLNYGSVALPFVPRSFAEELALCQIYYEKSYDLAIVPGTENNNTGLWFTNVLAVATANGARFPFGKHPVFKVRKRIAPTVTLYTYEGTSGQWATGGENRACYVGADESGFSISNATGGSVTPTAGEAYGHWVADAEL